MSLSRLFYLAGIKVDSTYLGHIGDQSVDNALDHVALFPAGAAYPVFTASKQWAPEWTVGVTDLAGLFALLGTDDLTKDLSALTTDLYFREAKAAGLNSDVTDSTKHQIYRLQSCSMMWWDSLQARQDDEAASVQVKVAAYGNGSNDPIQVPAAAISASAAQVAPWTLGPVKVNGSWLDGVQSVSIANNCEVIKHKGDGDAYPTLITIRRCKPVVTIETSNLRSVAAFAREGVAITALDVFLKRRKPSKLCYADGDAQHIKIAYEAGTLKWTGSRGDPAGATLEAHIELKSGSTSPWVVTASSAIS
jgi:hypothetical protein